VFVAYRFFFNTYLFRNSSIVETETNRQLLIKVKKPENGQLISNTNSMSTEYLINEQQNCSTTNEISSTNVHNNSLLSTSCSSEQTTTET
jgi:hypothetical protein